MPPLHVPPGSPDGYRLRAACRMLALVLACALALPASADDAPQPVVPSDALWVKIPQGDVVPFFGSYSFDTTDTKGQSMTYMVPAGNFIAGLVAAAATHGAMANAANEHKKQELRDKADKVLLPYADILKDYRLADLIDVALLRMKSSAPKKLIPSTAESLPNDGESIEFAPAFYMTQDQRALFLETTVQISRGKNAPQQIVIRIVSPSITADSLESYWKDGNGAKLKEVSAHMLSETLDLALANAHNNLPGDMPSKTVRYLEGGMERFERGQPLALECNQLLMRNLRGNLMSVPVKPGSVTLASASACPEAPLEAKVEQPVPQPQIGAQGIQPPTGM